MVALAIIDLKSITGIGQSLVKSKPNIESAKAGHVDELGHAELTAQLLLYNTPNTQDSHKTNTRLTQDQHKTHTRPTQPTPANTWR